MGTHYLDRFFSPQAIAVFGDAAPETGGTFSTLGAPAINDSGEVVGIVRSTESIYYKVEKGQQQNLQMVFKTCVPAVSLLKLIADEAIRQ